MGGGDFFTIFVSFTSDLNSDIVFNNGPTQSGTSDAGQHYPVLPRIQPLAGDEKRYALWGLKDSRRITASANSSTLS
jgi:hypothetical protein